MGDDCVIVNQTRSASADQSTCVLPETLDILTDSSRHIFIGIYVAVSVVSLVGNFAAIYSIIKRKYRFVQKTCIISLAISDILSTVVIATNNLETFSHKLLVWTLGSFLCSFIPMCQMAGITASSTALMFIAMDRYRNVVHALRKKWDPSPSLCLLTTATLWLIIFGISYPLYDFFIQEDVTMVYATQTSLEFVDAHVCVTFDKDNIRTYYIFMVFLIFLPLLMIFLWFYYNIASLVWKHRKPVCRNNASGVENSSSHGDFKLKNIKTLNKNRDIKVERKIRTFKVLITLMLVFIICRLPYFTVFILKLSLTTYGLWTWYLNYAFMALHILNCGLNPLLYTFLNQTLTVWIKVKRVIKDFTWEVCCFCFSNAEFDEFEKENPFEIRDFDKKGRNSKVKFEKNVQEIEAKY